MPYRAFFRLEIKLCLIKTQNKKKRERRIIWDFHF